MKPGELDAYAKARGYIDYTHFIQHEKQLEKQERARKRNSMERQTVATTTQAQNHAAQIYKAPAGARVVRTRGVNVKETISYVVVVGPEVFYRSTSEYFASKWLHQWKQGFGFEPQHIGWLAEEMVN